MGIVVPPWGKLNERRLGGYLTPDVDRLCLIDLSETRFIEPAGLVFVAAMIERASSEGLRIKIIPPMLSDCANYFARMGIQEVLNIYAPDVVWPTVNSYPNDALCELKRVVGEADLDAVAKTVEIQYTAAGGHAFAPLYRALAEITLNAVQHSGVGGGWVALQTYSDCEVAIAIADAGVGMRGTIHAETDAQSIVAASESHASQIATPGRGQGISSVIQAAADYGGHVFYLSGDASVKFTGMPRPQIFSYDRPFKGTLVETRLRRGRER